MAVHVHVHLPIAIRAVAAPAVKHTTRTLSEPPSTRAAIAMDGGVADTAVCAAVQHNARARTLSGPAAVRNVSRGASAHGGYYPGPVRPRLALSLSFGFRIPDLILGLILSDSIDLYSGLLRGVRGRGRSGGPWDSRHVGTVCVVSSCPARLGLPPTVLHTLQSPFLVESAHPGARGSCSSHRTRRTRIGSCLGSCA